MSAVRRRGCTGPAAWKSLPFPPSIHAVISFARERLEVLGDATQAALEAGFVRFRPVLMTALAMIIGMLPMALGLGEGGEQNAPLGRVVIGGLVFATFATLVFVPVVFSLVHRRHPRGAPTLSSGVPDAL
jgi:Cu/Ag efflux pump CusA